MSDRLSPYPERNRLANALTRRDCLRRLAAIGLAPTALLAVCAPAPGATPASPAKPTADQSAPTPAAAPATGQRSISITFWSATNPAQQAFWNDVATTYTAENPNVRIEVRAMPETPTSEAGIQAAIAGGTAPVASENIFIGFGEQLARSKAIVPLDVMPGWADLIKARHMEQTIAGWRASDGHYYVLPIYSNAMLSGWRIDILKQIGHERPPRTYGEIIAMGETLKQRFPDRFVWARDDLAENTWFQRWFDFFVLYDAASNGTPLVTGNQVSADDVAAVAVLAFLADLSRQKLLLTQVVIQPFETGVSVMDILGPWTFTDWAQKFPELKFDQSYTLTAPPVPDAYPASQPVKTFADAKGISFYAQAGAEQQGATWDFVRWVFSDPRRDLQWLQETRLPPARDDLGTDDLFKPYLEEHPELTTYARQIPHAVPPLAVPRYQEIQVALSDQAVIPIINGQKAPEEAWNDWKATVKPML
jgi:multiple sugar transport system substrate-binding protein